MEPARPACRTNPPTKQNPTHDSRDLPEHIDNRPKSPEQPSRKRAPAFEKHSRHEKPDAREWCFENDTVVLLFDLRADWCMGANSGGII
jgi:hypothetical protein